MTVFTSALAAVLFVVAASILAKLALGIYADRMTLIQCDSCHVYTPKSRVRFYAGDPVCERCRQELATDPRQ